MEINPSVAHKEDNMTCESLGSNIMNMSEDAALQKDEAKEVFVNPTDTVQ